MLIIINIIFIEIENQNKKWCTVIYKSFTLKKQEIKLKVWRLKQLRLYWNYLNYKKISKTQKLEALANYVNWNNIIMEYHNTFTLKRNGTELFGNETKQK